MLSLRLFTRIAIESTLRVILLSGSFACSLASCQSAAGQSPSASNEGHGQASPSSGNAGGSRQSSSAPQDAGATLRVRVNLVLVPVVVRAADGNAVGNLRAEDFRVFDNNKPQQIAEFAVEQAADAREPVAVAGALQSDAASRLSRAPRVFVVPRRFTALFFDDIHLDVDDLPRVRNAALRYLSNAPLSSERVGVYTSSGKTKIDFTDDRVKLEDALNHIRPEKLPGAGMKDCPEVTHFQADGIMNKNDQGALHVAVEDAIMFCGARQEDIATEMAVEAAKRALESGDRQARFSLNSLRDLVARLAAAPGQRSIVMVSPGFLVTDGDFQQAKVIDRAIRSRIVISALDARGLYAASPLGDASQRVGGPATVIQRTTVNSANGLAVEGVLWEIASETGGTFFHNSNDFREGFRRTAGVPEYTYVLGFSPSSVKLDGKFHTLKVTLNSHEKLVVTARRGYFAPTQDTSAEDTAKREIEQALFSSGQTHDLPVDLRVQTVKGDDPVARLTVQANVDLAQLPFRFVDGQKRNELTFVTAVFDRDGKYLNGNTRVIGVHWKPQTSENDPRGGKALDVSFILKSGDYLVRVVARDAESQHLFAEAAAVRIP
jgi:VWFA-related protein